MAKSKTLSGIAVSGTHGDPHNFELLLRYTDGREVGKMLPIRVAHSLRTQLVELLPRPRPHTCTNPTRWPDRQASASAKAALTLLLARCHGLWPMRPTKRRACLMSHAHTPAITQRPNGT